MDDDEGFRRFVRRQWTPLTRTAYLLTGDRGAAEDLVQAALEKAHRRWSRIERAGAPEVRAARDGQHGELLAAPAPGAGGADGRLRARGGLGVGQAPRPYGLLVYTR
jgi:hypothetical protein